METDKDKTSVPIGEIIDIINDHKPTGNIYNGGNSVEERTDEKITNVLDDIVADIVNSYPAKTMSDILNNERHGCVLNGAIRYAMNGNIDTPIIVKYAMDCLPFISDSTILIFHSDCNNKFHGNFHVVAGDIWEEFYNAVVKEMEKRGLQ